ncbi:hypothetical protein ACFQ96_00885, partial [Peribacillus simplex]
RVRYETPAGKASQGETPKARSVEEAPGPPAESECLKRKSTILKKVCRQKEFYLTVKTKLIGE